MLRDVIVIIIAVRN